MDRAKAAVSNFLSRDGKHETTVHETVNPAIQNERVIRTEEENIQKAVDREVHQDHYHTSVQPIQHREVLPEQRTHNMADVEERMFRHGNEEHVRQRLEAERAQFQSSREVGDVQRTSTEVPVVTGEHIHHHVHETIQPVIQKETVQPSVIHTTIPVHEVHHNEARHHAVSSLPVITMAEYKSQGGALSGREERTDAFAGEPRAVSSALGEGGDHMLGGPGAVGTTSITNGNGTGKNGVAQEGILNGGVKARERDGRGMTGSSTGISGSAGKPSLKDKINPRVDADGDGKAGIMD